MDKYSGQIALVLQGGGALGAYQVGVYEGLHDAGVEPDWVIGTSIGAVNVRNSEMRYFDSRDQPLDLKHVMASGALPPAFPAVRIDGDPYWDGGIYSNTPVEVVLDDKPRAQRGLTRDRFHAASSNSRRSARRSACIWSLNARQPRQRVR